MKDNQIDITKRPAVCLEKTWSLGGRKRVLEENQKAHAKSAQ